MREALLNLAYIR